MTALVTLTRFAKQVVWNQTSLVCVEKRGGQAVGAAQLQTCLATAQKRRDEMLPRLKEQAK